MAKLEIGINENTPIFTEYFHAITLTDTTTDLFNTGTTSFQLEPRTDFEPYDVIAKILNPLKNHPTKPFLRADGSKIMVPIEGTFVLPDTEGTEKYPLVIILHGNHPGYVMIDDKKHPPSNGNKGTYEITLFDGKQVPSFNGYIPLQNVLAEKKIASYSINLNIVNALENNERKRFDKSALDFNQRILLFFHHLKLLKIL